MITIIVIVSILYLALLTYITISYNEVNKRNEEDEYRILELEKRLEYFRKDVFSMNKSFNKVIEELEERIENLEKKRKRQKDISRDSQ